MITLKNISKLALAGILAFGSIATSNAQQIPNTSANQVKTDISTDELTKFAGVFEKVQAENQTAQQKMMGIIKDEGLELQRFNEIQEAKMNPQASVEASDEELKKHAAVIGELEKMQPELEAKMETIIEENGLTLDRYKAVAMALQQDKSLQQKFQGIMMKRQKSGQQG
ncbi:protein of unknown function [Leeuwenhoekiella marinoflava DSM 3653]|uniref:DUF4168 domain-containing protein n=3 Tax=Leeuwenhoekiella marinoflava TaxID=988 RepID=A0A4Q0PP00_9FLAO|nr:putative protein DUF4168 [Leeuwenhoekiella marinoflava]SHE79699.1 protein of unknown function [Leeuwenhoekiella marinoflava DSM 3653]